MSVSEAKTDKDHLILMFGSNSEKPEMNPQSASSESSDEPLFVLKYRREKVIKRLMLFLVLFGLAGIGAFDVVDVAHPLRVRVAGVIGLCIFVPLFLDLLLFREVRLHKDRIVKIWNYIGKREVNLADARLWAGAISIGVGRFKRGPYNKFTRIIDRRTNVAWSYMEVPYMGVYYDEMLADQDDVKKLNTLLADLTGRKVEEFEQPRIRIDRLIQGEGR